LTHLPATDAGRPPISPNAFILLAAWIGAGVGLVMVPEARGVFTFAFVIFGWVLAVVAHEFGHAFIAHKAGDPTIAEKGYLSLDPLKYADLGVSIVIPVIAVVLGGIGFPGGAVYLREDLMRSRAWRSAASLAGPFGTFVVLLVLTAVIGFAAPRLEGGVGNPLIPALAFLAFLQATALILNLLPVPGLDGYGILRPWLPATVREATRKFEGVAMMALLAVLFFVPPAASLFFGVAFLVSQAVGVPLEAIQDGYRAFRFWS
jgi:Zn-dependent protease